MGLRQQEDLIFGTTAGGEGRAGCLLVRVSPLLRSIDVVDDERMDAKPGTDRGYLLFPLRAERKGKPDERRRDRAVFNKEASARAPAPKFRLHLCWRGDSRFEVDLEALVALLGHLGALGFRSRRAMGALAFRGVAPILSTALPRFQTPETISVRELAAKSSADAIHALARWLKSWRSHGRSGKNVAEQVMPGFQYAKHDHDLASKRQPGPGYRPALGLPMLTAYGNWSLEKPEKPGGTKGRFASPVLLRPHRDAQGHWHALVIFVDAHKWPADKPVYLNGQPRNVSLDLYEAMKADPRLKAFS